MAVDALKEMTRLRDKALSRAADLNGFRKYWKEKYNDMVRKFDAAQAHAWEMEQKSDAISTWRAPGAAEVGQRALVMATNPLRQVVAIRIMNGVWIGMEPNSPPVDILAWCELPAVPSAEMIAGFE